MVQKNSRHVVCLQEWQKAVGVGYLWPSAATYRDGNGPANRNPLCFTMYSSTMRKARENSEPFRLQEVDVQTKKNRIESVY